jgi:hypothetical protein
MHIFIFTLQQFGWDKIVLHNYTHVNEVLHIHILKIKFPNTITIF